MQDDVQQDTTPSEQDFQALEGIWRSRGYGKLLLIRTEAYILHEETAVSCLPVDRGELQALT